MRWKQRLLTALFIILGTTALFAQATVTGTVTDPDGKKLQSVTVGVPKTSTVTTTDENGAFRITVPQGTIELEFTLVGYQKQTLPINGKTAINVTLQAASNALADVVVVGYGTQRKRDVTGTIASVKGDDIKNMPVSNAATALQGRASGVDIVRNDGAPGSLPVIRIRGTGTINNSDPLIVIDGVPAGNLNDVNPNDIASIEILKDASSSAIYGTRAANGVVLVTTKKGNLGEKVKTTVNAYTGNSNPLKYIPLATAPELVKLKQEEFTNDNTTLDSIWLDPYYATQRTDWQRELFNTGKTNNVDVALRGGSANSTYSVSGNYYDEKGMIINTYFQRYSARFNSEHKLGKRLKVGENFLYSFTNSSGVDTKSTQTGLVWTALRFNPAIPVHNPDGSWGSSKASNELGDINNPVFTASTTDQSNKTNRILTNAYIELEIIKGLTAKANFGYDYSMANYYNFAIATPDQTRVNSLANLTRSYSQGTSFLSEYFLTYNNIFNNTHSVNVTAGYSAQSFNSESYSAARSGYDDPAWDHRILDNGSSANQSAVGSQGANGLRSYFVRANYAFKSKYLMTFTMRADGSSRFPPDKRWGYFPAFSLGWRISDEKFFRDNISFINTLKITGGWGQMGNQEIPNFQYLSIIQSGGGITYNFGANTNIVDGSYVTSLSNPNITWERAEMTNISLEFGLLQNKLNGVVTYFDKNTKDMLIPYSLVENYGASINIPGGNVTIPNQNLGTLNNRGVEVELNYGNTAGKVSYSAGVNASFIKNKVTHLYGTKADYIGSTFYGRQAIETSRTYEGQPIASFYGYKTNGLYQNQKEINDDPNRKNDPNRSLIQPGDVRFLDMNGDGIVNNQDRVYLGDPNPRVTLGINGSVGYKGFELAFLFAGAFGQKLFNADRLTGLDGTQVYNLYAEANNRWHGEGTSNTVPRLSRLNYNKNNSSSDLWVESGNYMALKTATISYTFRNVQIAKVPMPQTRIYFSGYNLFYITKYKGYTPELGYTDGNKQRGVDVAQYPSARTLTIGATFNF